MSDFEISESTVEEELLRHGTYASLTSGTSMQPLFKTHRDMVVLTKVDRELKKYDVVLYHKGERKNILHRIIGKKGDLYVIRGDNTFRREYVKKEEILAVLVSFNRKGKSYKVTDKGYVIYSRVWNFIYPVRALLHAVRHLLYSAYRAVFKKNKNKKS